MGPTRGVEDGVTVESDLGSDRRLAARVASRAEIGDVRLFEASIKLVDFPASHVAMRYTVEMSPRVDYEPGSERFVIRTTYHVAIELAEADDHAPAIASIEFELGGLFDLEARTGDDGVSEAEFGAFARTTGQMALWPFAREYIFDATGRLGLPPLAVGMFRIPLTASDVDHD